MVVPVAWKIIGFESTAGPDTNNGFFQVAAMASVGSIVTHNDLLNVKQINRLQTEDIQLEMERNKMKVSLHVSTAC